MAWTVGAFGARDSFSYLAAQWAYGPGVRPMPHTQDVFDGLRQGRIDIGVVPLENVTGGWVNDVLQELLRLPENDPGARIIREIELPIVLCAAALPGGASLAGAARFFSHPIPLLHATPWILRHNPHAERVPVTSTSLAAEMAAKDPKAVALCNLHAARSRGLKVLLKSLPSQVQNRTRFVCVSKSAPATRRPSVTSLCFSTLNRPGSLHKAIGVLARNRINMVRLASQAVGSLRTHRFFVELEAGQGDAALGRALAGLGKATERLWVLGSYPVDRVPRARAAELY